MSTTENQPSEEELRAGYEEEVKKIRVEHLLIEQVVSLVNLGMRRTGLAPGTESERDPEQVRLAIEGIRAVMPLVEQAAPQHAAPIRDALSQLQLAFVRIGGQQAGGEQPGGERPGGQQPGGEQPGERTEPAAAEPSEAPPPTQSKAPPNTDEPGPAQRSGRLWVPGQ